MKDAVDRLTPLGLMVLALLREDDMHPYEMMRLMRQRHDDRLVTITNGTLYHTVGRLVRAGLLVEVGVDREGNRPERTTYSLTADGRDAVEEWVRRELPRTDHPAEFRIALAEAHNLDRTEVIDLLHERRSNLTGEHLIHSGGRSKALERGVPEQFLLEVERTEILLEVELRWTDALITRLEQHVFPWGADELFPLSERYLTDRKAARQ
ncbi:PadR family transcriptional regulator [Microbacterium rhizomatis]|uniref:PadR family transcriptional regulator n=1 Tax=Microbacterium rhizomatis TaxID=1631477 RepID=A0A5J5J173_9MICO|nr:PadR family transcriptional regulator [Microbacterium rhizomatis]KAA9106413.1 PadR family transcriptional regulator [Microbacterium rhizomatis]